MDSTTFKALISTAAFCTKKKKAQPSKNPPQNTRRQESLLFKATAVPSHIGSCAFSSSLSQPVALTPKCYYSLLLFKVTQCSRRVFGMQGGTTLVRPLEVSPANAAVLESDPPVRSNIFLFTCYGGGSQTKTIKSNHGFSFKFFLKPAV